MNGITKEMIAAYVTYLRNEEKSERTISKYKRILLTLQETLQEKDALSKTGLLRWKQSISEQYSASTVNTMIAAVNGFCLFLGRQDCRLRPLKVQRRVFQDPERELTMADYKKLVQVAQREGNQRLALLMGTLAGTGIRISELRFITVEAVKQGRAEVTCKGKRRVVFIPPDLCEVLWPYTRRYSIKHGPVFCSKNGKPLDRSNVWHEMKRLWKIAGIDSRKVFPHNFRHLFAVRHYKRYGDVVKLADLLGHSSINTTRMYLVEPETVHRQQVAELGPIVCKAITDEMAETFEQEKCTTEAHFCST